MDHALRGRPPRRAAPRHHARSPRRRRAPRRLTRALIADATRTDPIRAAVARSALGAWFDAELDVTRPGPLLGWRHRAAMGRDGHVRTVFDGSLFPIGHNAPLIVEVERRFTDGPSPVAYLEKKVTLARGEIERHCDVDGVDPAIRRPWPFTTVRLLTPGTPPLEGAPDGTTRILPIAGHDPFRWVVEAVDRRGETVRFSQPFLWVPANDGGPTGQPLTPECALEGKRVAMAPVELGPNVPLGEREATAVEVHGLTLQGEGLIEDAARAHGRRFYPTAVQARVVIEALAGLAPSRPAAQPVPVTFDARCVEHGFDDANPHQVFLAISGAARRASFAEGGTDKVGAFVSPNLEIGGLSRATGPIPRALIGTNPPLPRHRPRSSRSPTSTTRSTPSAPLSGCISLEDILATTGVSLDDLAPRFVTEAFDEVKRLQQVIERLARDAAEIEAKLARVAGQADEIVRHAQDLLDFVRRSADPQRAQRFLLERLDRARQAIEGVLADPEKIVERARRQDVEEAIAKVRDFAHMLEDAKTPKVIEKIIDGGAILRTAQRAAATLAGAADTAQQVVDLVWTTLDAVARARKVAKDKAIKVEWRPKLADPPRRQVRARPRGADLRGRLPAPRRSELPRAPARRRRRPAPAPLHRGDHPPDDQRSPLRSRARADAPRGALRRADHRPRGTRRVALLALRAPAVDVGDRPRSARPRARRPGARAPPRRRDGRDLGGDRARHARPPRGGRRVERVEPVRAPAGTQGAVRPRRGREDGGRQEPPGRVAGRRRVPGDAAHAPQAALRDDVPAAGARGGPRRGEPAPERRERRPRDGAGARRAGATSSSTPRWPAAPRPRAIGRSRGASGGRSSSPSSRPRRDRRRSSIAS